MTTKTPQPTPNEEPLAVMHVDLSITRQPESYQSVRAAVSLPVFVRPGDDLESLIDETLATARAQIHEEINREFEAHGYAAPYGEDTRYSLVRIPREPKLFAIVPYDSLKCLPNGWDAAETVEYGRHRYAHIRKLLSKREPSGFWDCSEMNVYDLPELVRVVIWQNEKNKLEIVTPGTDWPAVHLPEEIVTRYGYFRAINYVARLENMQSIINEHRTDGYALFDCRDGDFSRLPEPKQPEPQVPFTDDPDPEDYDDYEDEDEEDYN